LTDHLHHLALLICTGERTPWDQEISDESLGDNVGHDFPPIPPDLTELTQIFTDVSEIVDCLFRLSISIRNAPPHDRFKKAHLIGTSHFEASDIRHVHEVFPSATDPVVELLGKAISRRRQFFKYRELHHSKLAYGLDDLETTEDTGVSTVASSLHAEMKSGFVDPENAETDILLEDGASESSWTDTIYSSSALGDTDSKIPPLPKDAGERPFECPFCFTIVSATSTRAWM